MKKILYCAAALLAMTACTNKQTTNPFLEDWTTPYGIPPFDRIQMSDYLPAIKAGIEQQSAEIEAIITNTETPDFDNVIGALDLSGEILGKVQGAVSYTHLTLPTKA